LGTGRDIDYASDEDVIEDPAGICSSFNMRVAGVQKRRDQLFISGFVSLILYIRVVLGQRKCRHSIFLT
jgi:hypothetical protein